MEKENEKSVAGNGNEDAKKCLCIEGCSVNGECPIHGDATMRHQLPSKPPMARCPSCKRDIDNVAENFVTLANGTVVMMIWCANQDCRILFAMQAVGQAQQRPRIVRPMNPSLIRQ